MILEKSAWPGKAECRPRCSGPSVCLKKEVKYEPRRRAVGTRQAGRHPVGAALCGAAQGITGSTESAAVRSEHAGVVSPAAREIQAPPQTHWHLRRARPRRGHLGIWRSPTSLNLELGRDIMLPVVG